MRSPRTLVQLAAIVVISIVSPVRSEANPILTTALQLVGGAVVPLALTADLITVFSAIDGSTNQLDMTVSGDEYNFFLTIVGGEVLSDADLPFSGIASGQVTTQNGGTAMPPFWKFDFRIKFTARGLFVANDSMSINGFVQHEIGPDTGDDLFGPQLAYNFGFNADNATYPPPPIFGCANPGVFSGIGNNQVKDGQHPHIPHWDTLSKVDLSGTTSAGGLLCEFDDITGFTFQLAAHHTPNKVLPAPEPSSMFLITSALLAYGLMLSCRRILKK